MHEESDRRAREIEDLRKAQAERPRLADRETFEKACRTQNQRRDAEVSTARATGAECAIVDMLAFGTTYCTTHRVMGECPYGGAR